MHPDVHELTLDNGFRALLVERHNLPAVATVLWYQAGPRDENTGESGLSHFLEHMMFKGTELYAKGEIDLLTSKMGGANNAFTDHDSTVYHFSLPADRWETALEIEASRMRGCLLDPVEFEAEKQVVLEELAMGLDDPWTSLFQSVEAVAYQRHPYHRPIIGWKEEVERVSAAGMRAYYERSYGVDRALLVVVGAIDRAETESRIRDLFGGLPRATERMPAVAELPQEGERRAVVYAPGELPRIALTCHSCRIGERDDFVLDVLGQILGGGKSSRLHRLMTIRDQIATHFGVHNDVRLDPGLFWIYAELHPSADPAAGEATVREQLIRLGEEHVSQKELDLALAQIRASFVFDEETVLGTALKIARFEALTKKGYRMLADVLSVYESITLDDIRDVAQRHLSPSTWTAVWSLPEKQRANGRQRRDP